VTSATRQRDPRAVLERAVVSLQAPAAAPEQRLEAGDESARSAHCEAIEALAVVEPRLEPGGGAERRDPPRTG
jgi:hypothetical protein